MNEKKKGIILLIIASIFVLGIVVCIIVNYIASKKLYEQFEEYYASSEPKIVVLGKEGCSYCEAFIPELQFMSEQYGFSYEYIGVDKLFSTHYNKLLDTLEIDKANFGTPHTVIVQNNKKIAELSGAEEEDKILSFLKDNSFAPEDAKLLIDYIDYDGYVQALNSKDTQVIAIGRTTCIYCKLSKPVVNNVIKKYGVNIKYVNYDLLTEDELNSLYDSLDFFTTQEWGTPTFLIVKEGKLLTALQGYQQEDALVSALKNYGLIEG